MGRRKIPSRWCGVPVSRSRTRAMVVCTTSADASPGSGAGDPATAAHPRRLPCALRTRSRPPDLSRTRDAPFRARSGYRASRTSDITRSACRDRSSRCIPSLCAGRLAHSTCRYRSSRARAQLFVTLCRAAPCSTFHSKTSYRRTFRRAPRATDHRRLAAR